MLLPPPSPVHRSRVTRTFRKTRMESASDDGAEDKPRERRTRKTLKRIRKLPTDLAINLNNEQQEQEITSDEAKQCRDDCTPQDYFEGLLEERGYEMYSLNSLDYYSEPTELQIASNGMLMQRAVRRGDVNTLAEAFECGLSPNACNKYGKSLLHMACKRGRLAVVETMVGAGAVLQVSDDCGRTPLHEAFSATNPAYDIIELLLQRDLNMLFMQDRYGSYPLDNVHLEDWSEWKDWLDENIDNFFPARNAFSFLPSKTFPPSIPDKQIVISLEVVEMIASGKTKASEVLAVIEERKVRPSVSDDWETDSMSELSSDEEDDIW